MDAVLGIDGCGGARTVKTAVAWIIEEWRHDVFGLGIGGGRRPQRWRLKVKMVSAAAKCWSVGFGGWWVDVADGSRWVSFFFCFFLGLWVWVLWSEAGTDGGHWLGWRHWLLCWLGEEKLMWGCGVYTDCRGWFRLLKDLIGQILERYWHIWLV